MGLIPSKKKKRKPGDPPEIGSIEHQVQVAKQYGDLWQKFFQFFAERVDPKKITADHEKEFARFVYQIAYNHFKYTKMMGGEFGGGAKIMKILDHCPTLRHVHTLPDATFSSMQVDWHEVFIEMNKTQGRLKDKLPPPPEVRAKIEADKKAAKSKPKKKKAKAEAKAGE